MWQAKGQSFKREKTNPRNEREPFVYKKDFIVECET
jgi:hypothetical protein